ncbi:MAG: hypothetical protein ACW97V_13945 [Promethearchaeota archaeon]
MLVDAIDRQLIEALFREGRVSLSTLSKIIKKSNNDTMSLAGISRRISKLEKLGILNIQGNLSVNNLGYSIVFILMEMKNFDVVQNIIEMYSECPRIFLLAPVTGQYHLIIGVLGHTIDDLRDYINFCGPTNKLGIIHSEIIFSSRLITPKFIPVNLFSGKSREYKCANVCEECQSLLEGKCNGCGSF